MWKPIELQELQQLIGDSERAMNVPERRLWEFVRVSPTKWQQHPWGDEGGGFWVVGLFGNRALWYNDIELGLMPPATINSERSPTTSAIKMICAMPFDLFSNG